MYHITYDQLVLDVRHAFFCAADGKWGKQYVIDFYADFDNNIESLASDIWNRRYKAQPSTCFIIRDPHVREVFAAQFRDRIVHHLYFNYTHVMFERTFIYDSYSCIEGRGTHFGIERFEHHIRQESQGWTEDCYVLRLDIKGYFTHIDRNILLGITLNVIAVMSTHRVCNGRSLLWEDVIDLELVQYLTIEIILLDPTVDCIIKGSKDDWAVLPKDKSLFFTGQGKGLPIGNLTSQLFSNVYLGIFDSFMKREMKCRHYGRYVDDSFAVSCDKEFLRIVRSAADDFLHDNLCLSLNVRKTRIVNVRYGVEFIGAFCKPHRTYVTSRTLQRMSINMRKLDNDLAYDRVTPKYAMSSINSCLGVLGHYSSYRLRKNLFSSLANVNQSGTFDPAYTKYVLNR